MGSRGTSGIDLAAYESLKDMSKKYILHDGGKVLVS
jgi:hypothetical protein